MHLLSVNSPEVSAFIISKDASPNRSTRSMEKVYQWRLLIKKKFCHEKSLPKKKFTYGKSLYHFYALQKLLNYSINKGGVSMNKYHKYHKYHPMPKLLVNSHILSTSREIIFIHLNIYLNCIQLLFRSYNNTFPKLFSTMISIAILVKIHLWKRV